MYHPPSSTRGQIIGFSNEWISCQFMNFKDFFYPKTPRIIHRFRNMRQQYEYFLLFPADPAHGILKIKGIDCVLRCVHSCSHFGDAVMFLMLCRPPSGRLRDQCLEVVGALDSSLGSPGLFRAPLVERVRDLQDASRSTLGRFRTLFSAFGLP